MPVRSLILHIAVFSLLGNPSLTFAQGAMTNGESHSGAIAIAGELDQWTFTASQGDAIYVRIGEVLATGAPDPGYYPWIRLLGPTGTILGTNWDNVDAAIAVAAPLTGAYTVIAGSNYATTGAYRLTLAKAPGPFQAGGGDEGGALANGGRHEGGIDLGDIDMWSFSANQGDALYLRVGEIAVPPGQTDPGFYPWIRLIGPTGIILGTNWHDIDAAVATAAPLTGAYTVLIASNYGTIGRYRLTLAKAPGTFEVPQDDDGGPLINGLAHAGQIDIGDVDMWSFSASQGDAVYLRIAEAITAGEPDPGFYPWFRLIGPTGAILGTNWHDLDAAIAVEAPLTGSYTVLTSANYPTRGNYRLTLAKAPGSFQVPQGDQGGPLANGVTTTGRIDLGDVDMYSFSAAQGDSLYLRIGEIPVPTTETDPGFYPWLRLIGPTGDILRSNWDDRDAAVEVQAPITGTYTLLTASNYATVGNYRLTLAKAPGGFQTGSGDQGGPMSNAVDHAGDVEMGDIDMWSFTACQGQAVTVSMSEVPVPPTETDPGFYPWFRVVSPTGTVVATDFGNLAAARTFTPAVSGSFTVIAGAYYPAVGDYLIRVLGACGVTPPTAVDDSFSAGINTTLTIAAPGVLGNDLSPGGSALSASLVDPTDHGGVTLAANGGFTYTPDPGFTGTDAFTYRVSSTNGAGNVARVALSVSSAPQPPTGLIARLLVGNLVTVYWMPPTGGLTPTQYVLEGGVTPGHVLATIPTGSRLPIFTFAAPDGAFYLRVRTLAGAQTSEASNEIRVFVNQPVAPSAPSHLLGNVNNSSVALSWRPTFGGGATSSYVLDVTGTLSTSLPLGVAETFTFNGVPNGTYTFRVRAVNAAGSSAASNPVTMTFPSPCSGVPLVPADFLAFNVGRTVNVLWNPAASGSAATSFVLNVSGPITLALPLPARSITSPVPPGTYTFSVSAVNACGASAATAPQTVVVQ